MKVLIEVQGNKPLNDFGDNHVIAYDKNKNSYYVTTAETFFAGQNEKIKKMEEKFNELNNKIIAMQEGINNFQSSILIRVNNFQSMTDRKFNEFLQTYQDTNARLIAMVRELINANEEE